MTDITEHLSAVRATIRAAAVNAGRDADEILIVAVSKQQPTASVQAAYRAGQRDFGESYVQEAESKMAEVGEGDLVWHFIGRLQGNKTRFVAERFQWVHTLDRERIAERLHAQRPRHAPPLNVLIQVNLAREPQKAGVPPDAVPPLAAAVRRLDRLALRGLMTIPPATNDAAETRAWFDRLAAMQRSLASELPDIDTLSMGMSADFETAIAAGSTCVRVGAALFGPRRR